MMDTPVGLRRRLSAGDSQRVDAILKFMAVLAEFEPAQFATTIYGSDEVFNPYMDRCARYDKSEAVDIRRFNLVSILMALESPIDSLWVGRDLGWRGGRRTGIALTDEAHLEMAGIHWGVELQQATHNMPMREATATAVWDMLININKQIFLWNIFPFHPYDLSDGEWSNRRCNVNERQAGGRILMALVDILKPKRVVALGNDAGELCFKQFYMPGHQSVPSVVKVRHPSHGGTVKFKQEIADIYRGDMIQPQRRQASMF